MELIDTHCHLDFPVFDADREALLTRWRQLGWASISSPPWERKTGAGDGAGRAPRRHPLWPGDPSLVCGQAAPGCTDPAGDPAGESAPWAGGRGECGLDLRSHVPQEGQVEMFEAQVRLAMAHALPLIVHSVRANDTVAKILRRFTPPQGGSFTPSAVPCIRRRCSGNWVSGWGSGVISYERANKTREAIRQMPLEALLLETDAPDMPLQGQQGR